MRRSSLLLSLLVCALGCATAGPNKLFLEPSVKSAGLSVRRVAVIPNRLPSSLRDPERWRILNWRTMKEQFVARGFDVVDYDTTVTAFEKSGLPVEDTRSSRDKYADLAQALNVDLVVMPYYGTSAHSKGVIVINEYHFESSVTLQVYSTEHNDFIARLDTAGESSYATGYLMTAGILGSLNSDTRTLGLLCVLTDLVMGIGQALVNADTRWEKAFQVALVEGLKPVFAVLRAGEPGPSRAAPPPPEAPFVPPPPGYLQLPGAAAPPLTIVPPNATMAPPPSAPITPLLPHAAVGCQRKEDCKGKRVCVDGQCRQAPDACTKDADCPGEQLCQQAKCVAPPPEPPRL